MRSSKPAPRPLSAAMAFIAIASLTTIASAQSGSRSYGGGSSSQYRSSAPQSAGSSSRSSGSATRSNGSATQNRGSAAKVSAAEQQRQKQLLQQHLDEQQAQQEARQTKARAKQSQQKKASAERRLKQFQQVAADRGAKLALEGYCPVCVIDHQEWVAGDPKHSATYDGAMYFFPSDEPRRIFVSNPAKYVPALGGDCIVCYENGGKRVPGNVRRASLHQGRLFLFPGEDERAAFKQAPHEFENTDLAADGNCIVCKVKSNETVKGSERFTGGCEANDEGCNGRRHAAGSGGAPRNGNNARHFNDQG